MARLLVVDDEPSIRRALKALLGSIGHEVTTAEDGLDAAARLKASPFDLVITDLRMPNADGFEVLRVAHEAQPGTPVVVLTANNSIHDCVASMKAGAQNFLGKPWHDVELERVVNEALAQREGSARSSSQDGAARPRGRASMDDASQVELIGDSPRLKAVLEIVARVAHSDATVLIAGESGTGKEVVARLLHCASRAAAGPFVAVNCGAIPEGLVESELFGHAKGAFTGATERRVGHFAQAHGGTLFLDEVGELPPPVQVKLLRAIQEREITPVGDAKPQKVDVRIVAATHRDLGKLVGEGKFRADLYYRLEVVPIAMPPLRERLDDVPLLVRYFLDSLNRRSGRSVAVASDALAALSRYSWPGNVRELGNLIHRLHVLAQGDSIRAEDLPEKVRGEAGGSAAPPIAPELATQGIDLAATLAEIERRLIDDAMARAGGNKARAAALLGMNRTTLVEKLKRRT